VGDPPGGSDLPHLTTEQVIEVDRAMVEDCRIDLVQMMENAGRALADLTRSRFLDGDSRGRSVVVLAGTGGNGGGALVAGRRLAGWGADVRVYVPGDDAAFRPVAAHQLDIVRRLGVSVGRAADLDGREETDLIVEGIIGYRIATYEPRAGSGHCATRGSRYGVRSTA